MNLKLAYRNNHLLFEESILVMIKCALGTRNVKELLLTKYIEASRGFYSISNTRISFKRAERDLDTS